MVIPISPRSVPSPCRKICRLDDDNHCAGCGRSVEDIRDWLRMTEPERQTCVERAKQRMAQKKAEGKPG